MRSISHIFNSQKMQKKKAEKILLSPDWDTPEGNPSLPVSHWRKEKVKSQSLIPKVPKSQIGTLETVILSEHSAHLVLTSQM